MKYIKIVLLIVISFVFVKVSKAQEILADVTCNYEQVPASNKDYLIDFDKRVKDYINNTRWIGKNYGNDKIQVSLSILFVSGNSDNVYNAKVVIESQRPLFDGEKSKGKTTKMIRFLDDKWEFVYMKGQNLDNEERRFDPLTSFIVYYMYTILGFDSDTYEKEFGGSDLFRRAQGVLQLGAASPRAGWKKTAGATYSRWDLNEELLSVKMIPVRTGFFNYHYNGLDIKTAQPEEAYKNVLKALQDISSVKKNYPNSIIVKNFFDLKYVEIADFFKDYPDKKVYKKLIEFDKSHYKEYEKYLQ
jgi:hypothetical protein